MSLSKWVQGAGVVAFGFAWAACAPADTGTSSVTGGAGAPASAGVGAAGQAAGSSGSPAAGSGASGAGIPAAGSGSPNAGAIAAGGRAGVGGMPTGAGGTGGTVALLHGGVGNSTATATTLTASISMHQVAAGDEAHHCVVVELPNAQPVWVDALHATLTSGSHHLIVDRAAAQTAIMTTSASCSPTMAGDATRLLIAQQHDTRLQLPNGVAYRLDAHQRIFLQLHFINVGEKPAEIMGSVELTLATETAPKEAKSMFIGATNIALAAGQPGSATYFGKPPAQSGAMRVFALTSHTHQLGVRSTIERVASADAPAVTPLHESLDWSEPPLTQFSTPLVFDGSDGLRLTCRYMNTTTHTVTFGTAADDEMCFMWLYYYQ